MVKTIVHHLGLGDQIMLNGMVRHFAETDTVAIIVKRCHEESVRFMYRDISDRVELILVDTTNPQVIWSKQAFARIVSRSSIASPHLCIESIPSSIQRRIEPLMRSSISMISNSTRLFAICGLTVYRPLLRILGRTSDVTQR